jgi:hypothetical protein
VKTIKIEIPNDDALAMHHFGQAMVNMSQALRGDTTVTSTAPAPAPAPAAPETLPESPFGYIDDEPVVQLPWDERIHSGNKTQNQDGSWKMRKKPKDMTSEQWQEYIESVEAELTTLMSIPVETVDEPVVEAKQDLSMEKTAFDEEQFKKAMEVVNSDQGEVVETVEPPVVVVPKPQDATPPPPPVVVVPKPQDATPPPPPVTDVAPVGNTQDGVEAASGMTFVQLVQKMSSICNGDSDKSARIKEAIKEKYDVDFPALLKRPDLIPQVAAFLSTVEV